MNPISLLNGSQSRSEYNILFSDPKHRKYREFLGLGLEIAVAMTTPILVGYWLDLKWSTSPWMLFAGVGIGLVLMAVIFSRVIRKLNSEE